MLTIRERLITPFILGSMSVGLNFWIVIRLRIYEFGLWLRYHDRNYFWQKTESKSIISGIPKCLYVTRGKVRSNMLSWTFHVITNLSSYLVTEFLYSKYPWLRKKFKNCYRTERKPLELPHMFGIKETNQGIEALCIPQGFKLNHKARYLFVTPYRWDLRKAIKFWML